MEGGGKQKKREKWLINEANEKMERKRRWKRNKNTNEVSLDYFKKWYDSWRCQNICKIRPKTKKFKTLKETAKIKIKKIKLKKLN